MFTGTLRRPESGGSGARRPGSHGETTATSENRSTSDDEVPLLEPPPRTGASRHLLAIAAYLAVSAVLWAHVWLGGSPAHTVTCNCGDPVQQVWWFEWLPWALAHGHDPLLTNLIWARLGGANVLSNTSWLAPSAALAPITMVFGPVASFNVANLTAPVLSGWAAFALAGRISGRTAARVVAGGLYAFSPYVLRNTVLGHLDLTLNAYLPLVLLLGLGLVTRGGRPVRIGLWLGVLTIIEFFTSFEVLALTAITGSLFVVGTAIARPSLLTSARRRLLVATVVGASLSGVVLAYPIWLYVAGPRHVVGPYWRASSIPWKAIVEAGPDVFDTHTVLTAVGYLGPQGPNTDFLGLGLVLLVAVSCPLWGRRRSCIVVAGVGVASWVLECLPARTWRTIPSLSDINQARFALPVSLCVGLLLAASIDGWWHAIVTRWPLPGHRGRRTMARTALFVVVVAAFIPLVDTYSVPFRVTSATVPAWFERDAPHLAPGTAVLTIPFAYGVASRPMAWQAETHDDFDLIGGFAFVPGADGVHDEMMSPLGGAVGALNVLSADPGSVTIAQQETIRAAMVRWRPVVVVVTAGAPPGAARAVTDMLGLSPTWSGGVWVWSVGRTTRLGSLVALRRGG